VAGATFSWVGGGLLCMVGVLVAALLVRPFWRYDAGVPIPVDEPVTADGLLPATGPLPIDEPLAD
jgi:hypothetical protein